MAILKPLTSSPTSPERFLVCRGFQGCRSILTEVGDLKGEEGRGGRWRDGEMEGGGLRKGEGEGGQGREGEGERRKGEEKGKGRGEGEKEMAYMYKYMYNIRTWTTS